MLAKLIDWPISTQVPSVRNPESTTGASVKATSRRLRSTANSKRLTSPSAITPACTKAPAIVPAAAWVETGRPVASGATCCTARVKRSSTRLSLLSPRGKTCTRARPSGVTQSRVISGGKVSRVTSLACSAVLAWLSMTLSGSVSTCSTCVRIAWGAEASRSKAAASRRASPPSAPALTPRSFAAVAVSAATVSASLGGGAMSKGLSERSSSSAAS